MRAIILPFFLLAFFRLQAVTVHIQVNQQPSCSSSNGSLSAIASGGVGPYTFLWSPGGQATADISGLVPGTYSVTVTDFNGEQASDQVELMASSYSFTTSSINHSGLCNGQVVVGFFPPDWGNVGPPPYSVNGMMMQGTPYGGGTLYTVQFTAPEGYYGQFMPMTFQDGLGCSGLLQAYVGWPLEWPDVTVLDVQGSCSGGANGSITFEVGEEGHQQEVDFSVDNLSQGSGTVYIGPEGPVTVTGLAAGEHWIILSGGINFSQSGFGCYDSIPVQVPDLGTSCGSVSGMVYMDYDGDCTFQAGEVRVPGALLEVLPGPYYALSNSSGAYTINLPLGNFTIQQIDPALAEHCFGTPIPITIGGNLTGVDMADTSLLPMDARISGTHAPARPGFQFRTSLLAKNLTPASTGDLTATFTFDPAFSFVGADPPGNVAGNTITWETAPLDAFEARHINVYLEVAPDIGLLGTTLINTATLITANTDADLGNNSVQVPVAITGSFDPNDKVATTSSRTSGTQYFLDLDGWIDYTIRFQNTGTDTAFNIVITDTVPAQLDLGSLEILAASHPNTVSIEDGNVLRWAFDGIQLPDSNVNEPGSHGFVSFRVRPRLPLDLGTGITNTANIFFDLNPPVVTDPSVLVVDLSTGLRDAAVPASLWLAPVPVRDVLQVSSPMPLTGVRVFAADGRSLLYQPMQGMQGQIRVSGLKPGTYVTVGLLHDGGTLRQRFVKE
ncbi:MAG: T9SS type A sorting domain-containing protein [Flavobacteriales bacterium]|nr:T9SS type A sorting domain-containing protein [Flavobacteriales bacterium]MEB2342936.1 hypothetical protein [Flavobacteriia bacterium]